jgi:hypothetical protein
VFSVSSVVIFPLPAFQPPWRANLRVSRKIRSELDPEVVECTIGEGFRLEYGTRELEIVKFIE